MKKILVLLVFMLIIAGCAATDVVRREAASSFDMILDVSTVESVVKDGFAHIMFAESYHLELSLTPETTSEDVIISVPATPFLDAGLDRLKLPSNMKIKDDKLLIIFDGIKGAATQNASQQMNSLLTNNRGLLGYHAELDHFGISLGDHKFEWAKHLMTNDKDVVFILSAEVLRSAGVDVENVDGWLFTTMDGMGLLLKPFDLK